jgi:hypothetical protein
MEVRHVNPDDRVKPEDGVLRLGQGEEAASGPGAAHAVNTLNP